MTKTYTLADLFELAEARDQLFEILGGKLVVYSAPDNSHAEIVAVLNDLLWRARQAGYGRGYSAPRAVAFDFPTRGMHAEKVAHPDLFFLRPERLHVNGNRCVEGTPDLIIEVLSPSTRQLDLPGGDKWQIYQDYAVPYYWIVDPTAHAIQQFEHREGRLREMARLRPGDMLSCPLFPGITLDVTLVFVDVR